MCIVPTLTVKTPINEDTLAEYEFTWYEGNCNDEQTKEQIIQNTIDAINSGANRILGSIFSDSQNIKLNSDHFQVFCGAKVCVTTILKNSKLVFKMIFWFHFDKLRYAHYRLSIVSIIAMQSFKTVAPIEKAGETLKV